MTQFLCLLKEFDKIRRWNLFPHLSIHLRFSTEIYWISSNSFKPYWKMARVQYLKNWTRTLKIFGFDKRQTSSKCRSKNDAFCSEVEKVDDYNRKSLNL